MHFIFSLPCTPSLSIPTNGHEEPTGRRSGRFWWVEVCVCVFFLGVRGVVVP